MNRSSLPASPIKKKPGRAASYSGVVIEMGIGFVPVTGDELAIWLGGVSGIYDDLEEMIARDEELRHARQADLP